MSDSPQPRKLQKGDWFVSTHLVDLAVTLVTLGIPYYDPVVPYTYNRVGGKTTIKFNFELTSNIVGVPNASELMKMWPHAEVQNPPANLVAICKRVIWARRSIMHDVHKDRTEPLPKVQDLASGLRVVSNTLHAAVAYGLGYEKPASFLYESSIPNKAVFAIGDKTPDWLLDYAADSSALVDILDRGVSYVLAEGNEINPIAVAMAAFMNSVSIISDIKQDTPHVKFETPTGRCLWVKEGGDKWHEMLRAGYTPS